MNPQAFLPEFDREMANTRKALERIPADKLDFKPHEKSYSLLELGGHIANIPSWTFPTLDTDEMDLGQGWEPPKIESKEDILSHFEKTTRDARQALEDATPEQMMETWTLRTGDEVHFEMPKGAVLRAFVFSHLVHHRAQLTVYLRLLDVPVPGMYGPSADEQEMM